MPQEDRRYWDASQAGALLDAAQIDVIQGMLVACNLIVIQ